MKNIKLLLVLPGILAIQSVFSQTNTHLTLSSQYPSAGEKISLNYDPAGTSLDGKKEIKAAVFYLDNKDYPAADVDLKADGKLLKGDFSVPDNAKAFYIKISSGEDVDNNSDKGYVYLVYKDKQPIEGAYASEGYMLLSGMGNYFAKIKADNEEGEALYKKEFTLYPQSEKEYQTNYYYMIVRNPAKKPLLLKKITELEKSSDEKDLMLAANLLSFTKNDKSADSLNAIIKTKFPDGLTVKNEMGMAFSKEKDLAKKDSIYNAYIKKYPENATDNRIQDNFRVQLASAYLNKGDIANYDKYEPLIKNKTNLASTLNNVSYEWAEKDQHLDDAEKLSKQSLDIISEKIKDPGIVSYATPSQAKKNYESTYDTYADTYAYILMKEKKYDEALKYEQPVIDHNSNAEAEIGEHYVQILSALGQSAKAQQFAETAVKEGRSNPNIKSELKKSYIKIKGSDAGYDTYLTGLETEARNKAKAELAKTMINKPAIAFTLKDFDGKTISLADLKGKVVIVDFWATWCGPCKASFPGMQMAVTKYKDDPNVKFVFIDTWENGDNYIDGVKKFIADNKYTFHVLMDEKTEAGKQEKVVSAYGVTGIPTKFVIDKSGNIRFMYVGYSGSSDKVFNEVTNMIEMANSPDAYAEQAHAKAGSK